MFCLSVMGGHTAEPQDTPSSSMLAQLEPTSLEGDWEGFATMFAAQETVSTCLFVSASTIRARSPSGNAPSSSELKLGLRSGSSLARVVTPPKKTIHLSYCSVHAP